MSPTALLDFETVGGESRSAQLKAGSTPCRLLLRMASPFAMFVLEGRRSSALVVSLAIDLNRDPVMNQAIALAST